MADDKKMSSSTLSLDEQEERKVKKLDVAQEETKSSIQAITAEDKDFLDEETDFFWILQNVFWNALKSLFIIFVLIFIIWIIWRPGGTNEEKVLKKQQKIEQQASESEKTTPDKPSEKPQEKTPSKPVVKTDTNIVIQPLQMDGSIGNTVSEVANWHSYLEQKRIYSQQSPLYEGSWWLKQVQALYDTPVKNYIDTDNAQGRQQNINHFLTHLAGLLQQSFDIRSKLYTGLQEHTQKASLATQWYEYYNNALHSAYGNKQTANYQQFIEGKGQANKDYAKHQSEAEIRQLLLQEMEQYDKGIRNLYEIIYANQAAIAQDIRVVSFPSDPFERVLTPSQWREQ